MNKWLRLALISFLGLIVSIVALNILNTDNGMSGMNMGTTSSQSMVTGQANMPMANMNQATGYYNYYPGQWGISIMRERMPYWARYGMNNMQIPMQNMNTNHMPMQNMNMNQNMQGNMGQMQM